MLVHWAGQEQSPCGVKTVPFLPRTSVLRQVTCEACRKEVCTVCEGSGLVLVNESFFDADGKPNHCSTCGRTGLRPML